MGWRTVVVTSRAKLDLKMNHLVIRKEDTKKILISEISTLIIESTAISLTVALLAELSRSKVKVIFCDEKHNPFGELTSYYNKHDSSLMVKNQVQWQTPYKLAVWTEIVREKIQQQAALLDKFGKTEAALLKGYLQELEIGDPTNREGHAAKVYFNALFGMQFSRDQENATNAALNYGYAILLSTFNQEIANCGYLTQLGIFHDNRFNPYNLASDLMEPFRPIVDDMVLALEPGAFGKEEKRHMLKMVEKDALIDKRRCTLRNAIGLYCRSVFNAVESGDVQMIKFCTNEL